MHSKVQGRAFYSNHYKRYEYVSLNGPELHFHFCPCCNCMTQSCWLDAPEDQLEGWVCMVCDEMVDNQYDPSPTEQWEVTEGSDWRERWDVMVRNLKREGIK